MDLERPPSQDSSARVPPGRSLALTAALIASFAVLVTANSAGYRFGVSDQAFYVPAVERLIAPSLFPRDAALIDSQARLTVSDDLIARIVLATRATLPAGLLHRLPDHTGRLCWRSISDRPRYYASVWTSAALLFALTFRHRLLETGVNSFEGYFHPRGTCLRGRDCRAGRVPRWPPRVGRRTRRDRVRRASNYRRMVRRLDRRRTRQRHALSLVRRRIGDRVGTRGSHGSEEPLLPNDSRPWTMRGSRSWVRGDISSPRIGR